MSYNPSDLSDQDFLVGHLSEYLDGELDGSLSPRFEELLKQPGQEEIPQHFQAMRGRLQLAIQSHYLKEDELATLRNLVQDPESAANIEAAKVDSIGRHEQMGLLRRKAVLLILALGVIGILVWRFAPETSESFKPLEYLGYEAVAMQDDPGGRLDLPSRSLKEIRAYLSTYPGLPFRPQTLRPFSKNWTPEGATVVDYEVAKVSAVQYGTPKSGEKLFHFSYKGKLEDLPKSELGDMQGLRYQTYANDDVNLIAWQHAPDTVSLLVGRRGAVELAGFAVAGGGK